MQARKDKKRNQDRRPRPDFAVRRIEDRHPDRETGSRPALERDFSTPLSRTYCERILGVFGEDATDADVASVFGIAEHRAACWRTGREPVPQRVVDALGRWQAAARLLHQDMRDVLADAREDRLPETVTRTIVDIYKRDLSHSPVPDEAVRGRAAGAGR